MIALALVHAALVDILVLAPASVFVVLVLPFVFAVFAFVPQA